MVDDDPGILDLVRELLSSAYEVDTATNGRQALEHLQGCPYDLVLTDMVMPDMGGMELVKHLRIHYPEVPVLVFTGYANFQDAVQAVKLGAFDYLTKPIQTEILHHAIRRALEFRRLTRQQKDLEVVFQGAEALGWQALDLISDTREAAILERLGKTGETAPTLEEAAYGFLAGAEELVGATRTSIFLYDAVGGQLQGLAARGPHAQERLAATVPMAESLMGYVASQRRPLLVSDLEVDQRLALWTRQFPYLSNSFMIIPLMGTKFWGVLNLTDRADGSPFTPRDLFLGWLLGRLLVEVLEARESEAGTETGASMGTLWPDYLPLGLALVNRELKILQANPALEKLAGGPDQVEGQELARLFRLSAADEDLLRGAYERLLSLGEAQDLGPVKCSLEGGCSRFLSFRLLPSLQPPEAGQGLVLVEDVSELEQLKQRLHLYEHLAIMGKLSLCVAHELNNPLDGVRRYLNLAQQKKDNPQEVERYLQEAQKGLHKMSMTIRSLMSSANPIKAPRSSENLLGLLQDAVKIMM